MCVYIRIVGQIISFIFFFFLFSSPKQISSSWQGRRNIIKKHTACIVGPERAFGEGGGEGIKRGHPHPLVNIKPHTHRFFPALDHTTTQVASTIGCYPSRVDIRSSGNLSLFSVLPRLPFLIRSSQPIYSPWRGSVRLPQVKNKRGGKKNSTVNKTQVEIYKELAIWEPSKNKYDVDVLHHSVRSE